MTSMTITERLEAGESIDETDLRAATDAELVAVVKNESYPVSLRDAAHAALVEVTYDHLKMIDRVRPGRTPWQTLRRRAILVAASTLGEAVSVGGSPELDDVREKAAELLVLDRFDTLRRVAGHDYGAAQRHRELVRLCGELSPNGTRGALAEYVVEKELGLELTAGEKLAAFYRVARSRRARIGREDFRRSTPATQRTLRTWAKLENALAIASVLEQKEEELIEIEPGILATREAAAEIAPSVVAGIADRIEAGELVSDKSMSDAEFLAPILDDETPAEELGRLRRELSELDHETPEHAAILDRIAVLTREEAERRRNGRRAAELRQTIRDAELELEKIERPDISPAALESDDPPKWLIASGLVPKGTRVTSKTKTKVGAGQPRIEGRLVDVERGLGKIVLDDGSIRRRSVSSLTEVAS